MTPSSKYRHIVLLLGLLGLIGCAALPENVDRRESYAFTDTEDTAFGRARAEERAAHPGQSGFYLLGNGLDAFVARALLCHYAERSIDVQYYLFHDDLTGTLFVDQLLKAADRGVRVRLLVDDMDLAGRDLGAAVLDSHPHMEVRIFNPFSRNVGRTSQFVTRMGSVTRRAHNKSFTVDNQLTILGGRNIGDEYFEADPNIAFSDLDVVGIGPVVDDVSESFDLYWNHALSYPALTMAEAPPTEEEAVAARQRLDAFVAEQQDSAYLKALRDSNLAERLRNKSVEYFWGEAKVMYDHPDKILHDFEETEYHLSTQINPLFESIKEELIIFSPYFVPGKAGTAFLTQLCEKGVRVRILTNSLASTDVGIVHAGYVKYRRELLRAGVELYEVNMKLSRKERKEKKGPHGSSKASLHAKSFIFDGKRVFIGSLNLDPRAVLHNTEIGVVIDSEEMAVLMTEAFDRNIEKVAFRLELNKREDGFEGISWHGWEQGEPVVYRNEPHTGFWRRFGIGFMSLFPIESQL